MELPNGVLVDKLGNPIPDKGIREKAAEQLQEYMVKEHLKFQHWFNEYGAFTRPPIVYDMKEQRWIWIQEND